MRNLKKFLALVLATLMLLSVAVISTGAADEEADYTEAAQRLMALQILKGDENGNPMLDQGVTRYQAALFFVQALTGETAAATWNTTKTSTYFSDVKEYGTAIDYAYGINVVKGRGNGMFGPNDAITYQDMLVMAVRALGYETADMSYPFGYILAAQKLGLTENVGLVDFTTPLTRGATAQIIWDMLDTEVAVIDPITDKVLYPGESGLTDSLLSASGAPVTGRETLLVQSELAGDKITAWVEKFVEADEKDEDSVDTVILHNGMEIAAADLDITAETPAVSYLGLPREIYISVDSSKFDQNAYDKGDAEIIFSVVHDYENVVNLGDGNIKYVKNTSDATKSYLTIGGTKFVIGEKNPAGATVNTEADKYFFEVYDFTASANTGWDVNMDIFAFANRFEYAKNEYKNAAANTFVNVQFAETDRYTYNTAGDKIYVVEILVSDLAFGQYNVRELKDRANGSALANFTTVATYDGRTHTNYDEVDTMFKEVVLGSSYEVTKNTSSVSAANGELAKSVTLAGETVAAGDFMFYTYNKLDNILTVYKNAGTFETGRLTAKNDGKETVKIDGTNYEFGFAGPFATISATPSDYVVDYQAGLQTNYISKLEAGKDNVKYILVDGNIVYMEPASETRNDSKFDFVVVSRDPKIVSDVLGFAYDDTNATTIANSKYVKNLSGVTATEKGVYVADNGYVAVAVLSKTTGEWELGYIKAVVDSYDAVEDEFTVSYDVASLATYVDMFKTPADYQNYTAKYVPAMQILDGNALFAVVEEKDGVYTVAAEMYDSNNDNVADKSFFVSAPTTDGIIFSDNNTLTNAITADTDVDAERVNVDDDTVIIIVDGTNAGARVGVQAANNSFLSTGRFLAASSDLIVLDVTANANLATTVLDSWKNDVVRGKNETWYLATVDSSVDVENAAADKDDEEKYTLTFTNVIDMKTLEVVEAVTYEVDKANDPLTGFGTSFNLLHKKGDLIEKETQGLAYAIEKCADDNDEKLNYTSVVANAIEFVNANTIKVAELALAPYSMNTAEAVNVNVTVVTNNLVIDAEDYDFEAAVLSKEYNAPADDLSTPNVNEEEAYDEHDIGSVKVVWGVDSNGDEVEKELWNYALDTSLVNEITEPADGVLNTYILANTETIIVPEVDSDDYTDGIECNVALTAVATYEDGVVNVVVYKTITQVGYASTVTLN